MTTELPTIISIDEVTDKRKQQAIILIHYAITGEKSDYHTSHSFLKELHNISISQLVCAAIILFNDNFSVFTLANC